jgi:hypothetical protein
MFIFTNVLGFVNEFVAVITQKFIFERYVGYL